jgi:hypothetical protein
MASPWTTCGSTAATTSSRTCRVDHGEKLTDLLETGPWPWNAAFGERAATSAAQSLPFARPDRRRSRPDRRRLIRLAQECPEVVRASLPSSSTELPEDALGDETVDFPLDSLDDLLSTRYRLDPSPTSGSSIALLLTDDDGARVLLEADALQRRSSRACGPWAPPMAACR